MIFSGLGGFLVATERSRPSTLIAEVRFDIWSDYPSQKTLQSMIFYEGWPRSGALRDRVFEYFLYIFFQVLRLIGRKSI